MKSIKDFLNELPLKVAPEALEDVNTILHFDISGDQGGIYTLKIENGQMSVDEGLIGDAKSTIKASDTLFILPSVCPSGLTSYNPGIQQLLLRAQISQQ